MTFQIGFSKEPCETNYFHCVRYSRSIFCTKARLIFYSHSSCSPCRYSIQTNATSLCNKSWIYIRCQSVLQPPKSLNCIRVVSLSFWLTIYIFLIISLFHTTKTFNPPRSHLCTRFTQQFSEQFLTVISLLHINSLFCFTTNQPNSNHHMNHEPTIHQPSTKQTKILNQTNLTTRRNKKPLTNTGPFLWPKTKWKYPKYERNHFNIFHSEKHFEKLKLLQLTILFLVVYILLFCLDMSYVLISRYIHYVWVCDMNIFTSFNLLETLFILSNLIRKPVDVYSLW